MCTLFHVRIQTLEPKKGLKFGSGGTHMTQHSKRKGQKESYNIEAMQIPSESMKNHAS